MTDRMLTAQLLKQFRVQLFREEKSPATVSKYIADTEQLLRYADGRALTRELVLAYKQSLLEKYAPRSVNAKLVAVNRLFAYLGWNDFRVRQLRLQRETYSSEDRELTKSEYFRLLDAAGRDLRLNLALQSICATGIRVSELAFFTVEAVRAGAVRIRCKGKNRKILLPSALRKQLLHFAKQNHIRTGVVFRTASGKPLDRSNLWAQMKRLCSRAGVNPRKVFPHNLRKLFARTFYALERDIAKLADVLGHSSINTTRIYIMSTGAEHSRILERMALSRKLTTELSFCG